MKMVGQILLWLGFLSGALATVYQLPVKGFEAMKALPAAVDAVAEHGSIEAAARASETDEKAVQAKTKALTSQLEQAEKLPSGLVGSLRELEIPAEDANPIPWTWYLGSAVLMLGGVVLLWVERSAHGQQTEETRAGLKTIKGNLEAAIVEVGSLRKDLNELPPSKITAFIDDRLADDLRSFAEGRDSMTAEYGLTVFAEVMTQFASGERAINRAWSAAADGYVDEAADCLERGQRCLESARDLLREAEQATPSSS